jgi:hypothetical protein
MYVKREIVYHECFGHLTVKTTAPLLFKSSKERPTESTRIFRVSLTDPGPTESNRKISLYTFYSPAFRALWWTQIPFLKKFFFSGISQLKKTLFFCQKPWRTPGKRIESDRQDDMRLVPRDIDRALVLTPLLHSCSIAELVSDHEKILWTWSTEFLSI